MLRAFELGGDFHSRTAMSMYDYVAKAVESGEVLLEAGDGMLPRQGDGQTEIAGTVQPGAVGMAVE